jgi:hypothetical protein
MHSTNDFPEIKVNYNNTIRKGILIGLVILLIISIVGNYFILLPANIEGTDLGYLLVPLIIISEIPILVNYLYLVILKFIRISIPNNTRITRISKIFTSYYSLGLIFHSIIYTIVTGFVLTHTLLVMKQATLIRVFWVDIAYCTIFLVIIGLIWVIEYFFWTKNWPLYLRLNQKVTFLYWFYWFSLFSTSVFAIFHSGAWSQSIFLCIGYITFAYVTLAVLVLQDILDIRVRTQDSEFNERLVN